MMPGSMVITNQIPSHPQGGEGRAALAAKGEGVFLRSPAPRSPWIRVSRPLPLKGERGFEHGEDRAQNPIEIRHHVGIGKPKDTVAAFLERPRSGCIIDFPPAVSVPIKLDDKPLRPCSEVGDVRRYDDLALEFDAQAVRAKAIPKAAFRFGKVRAQCLSAVSCLGVPLHVSPSPGPFGPTLSRKEERGSFVNA